MEEASLLCVGKLQSVDPFARRLLTEWERIVSTQHHALTAAGIQQITQCGVIGHPRVEVLLLQILTRVTEIVRGDQVWAHVETVFDAANGVGKAATAMRHAHAQFG